MPGDFEDESSDPYCPHENWRGGDIFVVTELKEAQTGHPLGKLTKEPGIIGKLNVQFKKKKETKIESDHKIIPISDCHTLVHIHVPTHAKQ